MRTPHDKNPASGLTPKILPVPYHLRITPTAWKRRRPDIVALGKSADWVEETIAAPRRQGRDIFVEGQALSWDDIDRIQITETDQAIADQIARSHAAGSGGDLVLLDRFGRDVTEQFLTGPPGARPDPEPSKTATFAANRKAVMVIYGHDAAANTALFDWLRSIGLQPQEWSQLIHASGSASPYIGQVLDQTLRNVQAVIAFFTPDERVTAAATPPGGQGAWRFQARPNVLIEAGMALSTHPTRTILAVLGTQELPSDLAGRHYVRLSHTAVQPLHDLAGRLRDAGCDTDTTGTDWLNPARFPNRDTITPPPSADHPSDPAEAEPRI
jgi:predicted nucleotide-binding protein